MDLLRLTEKKEDVLRRTFGLVAGRNAQIELRHVALMIRTFTVLIWRQFGHSTPEAESLFGCFVLAELLGSQSLMVVQIERLTYFKNSR